MGFSRRIGRWVLHCALFAELACGGRATLDSASDSTQSVGGSAGASGSGASTTGAEGTAGNAFCALSECLGSHIEQSVYLKASNTGDYDGFGNALALEGDTLAVGAPSRDAVYVFGRDNGTWSQQAYLEPSDTGTRQRFGHSVGLSGDTLVVGAIRDSSAATGADGDPFDGTAPGSGAVYVFERIDGTWSEQAYLKASNTNVDDGFGFNVSLSGDTLAVAATTEGSAATGTNGDQSDNSAPGSGAVYVFERIDGTWAQQAYLKASNTARYDGFGASLGLWGDTLAVGAIGEGSSASGVDGDQSDDSVPGAGAVYVFERGNGTWAQQAYLKASNPNVGDAFGASVGLSSNTLAIGASSESSAATGVDANPSDNFAYGSGAVYVFAESGDTWSEQAYLKASNTGASDMFGSTLALFGTALAVGAPGESSAATGVDGNQSDDSAFLAGAVYVFEFSEGRWVQRAYLKASNTESADRFGASLGLSGSTLAVGANSEGSGATGVDGDQTDNSAYWSGAVYLFDRVAP